jgi:hypothetical protein
MKLGHEEKSGTIIFPNHGNREVGRGLEKKLYDCPQFCQ